MTRPRGFLRGARPVGDFYIDDYAIEILPVGVDRGFFAYYRSPI